MEDIINYDAKEHSIRDDITAKVVVLAMDMLSKDYAIDHSLAIKDDKFNTQHGASEFLPIEWLIKTTYFRFGDADKIGEDILTLGHEVKHYADKTGRKDTGKRQIGITIHRDAMSTFLSEYLVSGTLFNQVFSIKNDNRETKDLKKKQIEDYLFGRYFLSGSEVEARQFSYDFGQSIIDYANSIGSPSEQAKANIDSIRASLDHERLVDYYLFKKYSEIVDDNNAVVIDGLRRARNSMDRIYKNGESVLDLICTAKSVMDFNLIMGLTNDSLYCVEESLHLDYDDVFANRLFDNLMKNDNPKINTVLLSVARNLVNCTQFQPTDRQKATLINKINENNKRIIDEGIKANIIDPKSYWALDNDKEMDNDN